MSTKQTKFLCLDPNEEQVAEGATLVDAFRNLNNSFGGDWQAEECFFYEVDKKPLAIELSITKKDVVTKISKVE